MLTQKDGTKYYFGTDGRLLIKQDRFGNRIKFYCDTESYKNVWGKWKEYPYITKIVDTVGREVVFTTTNKKNGDITLTMTVTNPDNSEDNRVYTYTLDKLSDKEIGIMGSPECQELAGNEWVLSSVKDAEGWSTNYTYT